MYTTVSLKTTDQALTVVAAPKLASGGKGVIRIDVEFDDPWEDMEKTAVMYMSGHESTIYYVAMENDVCVIPEAAVAVHGALHVALRGVAGDQVLTTEEVVLDFVKGPKAPVA